MSTLTQFLGSGIKSIQSGVTTVGQTVNDSGIDEEDRYYTTVTLSTPVNTSKSIIPLCTINPSSRDVTIRLINSTTLRVSSRTVSGASVSWQVIEFG